MFTLDFKSNQGVTFIELMVIIALIAISLLVVVPSFSDFFAKQRIRGLGDNLLFFSKLAKAEAAKKSSDTYIVFKKTSSTSWCIGLSASNKACDCNSANSCTVDSIERVISSTDYKDVKFDSLNFDNNVITTSPYRGRSNAGRATFSAIANGVSKDLSLVRNKMGRDKVCSPSGNSMRYPAC